MELLDVRQPRYITQLAVGVLHGAWSCHCIVQCCWSWGICFKEAKFVFRNQHNQICDSSYQKRTVVDWMHFNILVQLCMTKIEELRSTFGHKVAMLHPSYTYGIIFELIECSFIWRECHNFFFFFSEKQLPVLMGLIFRNRNTLFFGLKTVQIMIPERKAVDQHGGLRCL